MRISDWSSDVCSSDLITRLRGSGGGVLELLQRAHLDLDRGGLGGEPLLFLGEGADALAARLGRHADGGDLQQAGQRERADALLADRALHGGFERGHNGANLLGGNAGGGGDMGDQARLAEGFLEGRKSVRAGKGGEG